MQLDWSTEVKKSDVLSSCVIRKQNDFGNNISHEKLQGGDRYTEARNQKKTSKLYKASEKHYSIRTIN